MAQPAGYIPISRKIFDHPFWKEKRAFSKFEAWIDLLQTARYEESIKTEYINSKPVKWGRGQLPASVRYLMERWRWGSITKVETYLKNLQNEDMISLEKGQGINIITICKYDDYNLCKGIERTVEISEKDSERTVKGRGKDKTNKDNKVNKEITIKVVSPETTLFNLSKSYWLDEFHHGWHFDGVKGKALKSLLAKLTKLEKDRREEAGKPQPTNEDLLNLFIAFCQHLPEYYKSKDLPVIDTKYNEIIEYHKLNSNGTKQQSPRTSAYESASPFRS